VDPTELAHLRHELRTPLNHIIGYGEMLLEEAREAGRGSLADALGQFLDEARRLLGLVNERLAPGASEATDLDLPALARAVAEPLSAVTALATGLRAGAEAAGAAEMVPDLDRILQAAGDLRQLVEPSAGRAAARPERSAGRAERPVSGSKGLILVVDDDINNREILERRLHRDGYATRAAGNGQQALEALRPEAGPPVDMVLLDVMMPVMDGHETLRRLKADPATRAVPVLMISALGEIDSVVRCIELGAEDYLPKPFEPVLLRARIGACLEKKRLRDQELRQAQELAEWNRNLEARVAEQVAQLDRLGRLKRFFSPQLAELILEGGTEDPLRSHRCEITVVFLDLRGFTAFAETAEPEEVMALLAQYHAEMGRLILAHEGTLERFTGDGLMVFFNDPVLVPDPAVRAVRMALAMRDRVGELAAGWRRQGHDLGAGIGIAQGFATLGAIGFEGRMDYGAIGTVTNLAARLCAEAAAGQILVAQRVAAAVEEVATLEALGPLSLKGFGRPVPAFTLLGPRLLGPR